MRAENAKVEDAQEVVCPEHGLWYKVVRGYPLRCSLCEIQELTQRLDRRLVRSEEFLRGKRFMTKDRDDRVESLEFEG